MKTLNTIFDAWLDELKMISKDEGVLLFFLFLPIAYPLIYSWIYNNEVAREVPVVLIDNSHSAKSREFAQKYDASPDVCIAYRCGNMSEAKSLIGKEEAYGIIYIPHDFDKCLGRHTQAHISIYCDMSYMLAYKAIYQTATAVCSDMGATGVSPLLFEEVPIFNTTGGYGNFIIPGVLVLIIQQALLLGVGMIAGTRREERYYKKIPDQEWKIAGMLGHSFAYLMIFSIMLAWITLVVPRIFGFVSLVHGSTLFHFLVPYLLACVFFAITVSSFVRYRESVMLIVVFTSLPMLFLSGVSWPLSSISGFWQGVSYAFPSTFGIRGFIRMSSMGAELADVEHEYFGLWIQTIVYFLLSCTIYQVRGRFLYKNQDSTTK